MKRRYEDDDSYTDGSQSDDSDYDNSSNARDNGHSSDSDESQPSNRTTSHCSKVTSTPRPRINNNNIKRIKSEAKPTGASRKTASSKAHQCDKCHKSYSLLSSLREHQRTHVNSHPYACTEEGCEKKFTDRSSLRRHLRAHSGELPFACNDGDCKRRFARKDALVAHRRTHVHQREREQFMCQVCGDQLSSNAKLTYHMTAKHANRSSNDVSSSSSSSSSAAASSGTSGKTVKSPSPLPRAAASVPLASRPRVIARIVRQAKASGNTNNGVTTYGGASTPLASSAAAASSELNHMLYVPPPMTPLSSCHVTAVSDSSHGSKEGKGELHEATGDSNHYDDDIKVKCEPLSPQLSQASYSSSSIDLRYDNDDDNASCASVRRSTRLILQCCEASCGAIFHSRPSLARHERTHIITGPLICSECKCECRNETELRQHESDVHGNMASAEVIACGPFPCSSCGQIFKRRGNLLRHIKLQVCQSAIASSVPQPRRQGSPIAKVEPVAAMTSPVLAAASAPAAVAAEPCQLLQGGFFPVPYSDASCDKESMSGRTCSDNSSNGSECPLSYGDNGDCSPAHYQAVTVHDNGVGNMDQFVMDSCIMSPLPSGMALNGSPIIPSSSLATTSAAWSLDDPLLYDIYTLDASSFQL